MRHNTVGLHSFIIADCWSSNPHYKGPAGAHLGLQYQPSAISPWPPGDVPVRYSRGGGTPPEIACLEKKEFIIIMSLLHRIKSVSVCMPPVQSRAVTWAVGRVEYVGRFVYEVEVAWCIWKAPETFGTVIWDKLEATFGLKSVQPTLYLTMHMLIANKWWVSCTVSENCKQNKK